MKKITHKNKDLIQSYILTTAKYDFTASEKRVLYRIVEILQAKTEGLKLNYDYSLQEDLFQNTEFTVPIGIFRKDENDKNYKQIRNALRDLRNKSFEYEDDDHWGVYGIIETPKHQKHQDLVTFTVTPLLMGAFLNFTKGFRKFELTTAMEFKSVFSMRIYELLSGKETPITYSIEELKKMFKVEKKYKLTADFIRSTIAVAQKELTEKSPYSFHFEKKKIGRKVTHITFKPYYISKNRDQSLERKDLVKQVSISYVINNEIKDFLQHQLEFSDKEIKNNFDLFKNLTPAQFFDEILTPKARKKIRKANNPKGYLISIIKKHIGI